MRTGVISRPLACHTAGTQNPPMPPSSAPLRAAGGVLWRGSRGVADEVALVRRPGREGWALPSGEPAPGETELEAAVRAVREQAGHAVALGRFLGAARHRIAAEAPGGAAGDAAGRLKLVSWWAMRAVDGAVGAADGSAAGEAPDDLRWLDAAGAEAALNAAPDREVLARFLAGPAEVGRVVLLRHCEAEQWRGGDDALRPLTAVGRARAARLPGLVGALGVAELWSSPALRCVDTLAPAAAALGHALRQDPLFGEGGAHLSRAAEELERRGRSGQAVLVCTHAPLVGRLLERFAEARPALLPRPARLDAGGAWCVEFTADAVTGMAYLAPPLPEAMP